MPFDASRAPAALFSSLVAEEADGASRSRPALRPSEEERLVYTLSVAAETWCGCAPGHLSRVARLTVTLGQEFGFTGTDLTILRHGALLHDLGKLGVSESVLHKPSTLTAEEFVEIRRHPEIGADILKRLNLPSPVRTLVLQHHEWYDGRGYPRGLAGEEIAFGARLLAVADAFDALITDRPYRKARTQDEALEAVRLRSGEQFDPLVVRALLELADELPLPEAGTPEMHTERSASPAPDEQTDEEPCGVH
jgi:putative nucleotidyltransferase with HDIG domain